MKIEQQVTNLEHSSKLATLGIKQSSLFYWAINSYNKEVKKITMHPDSRDIVYSAFTVAELGVMLPEEVSTGKWDESFGFSVKSPLCHKIDTAENLFIKYPTEAQARAAILIYLLENKLTTAVEINNRLTQ